jgi:hypothetical protein
MKTKKTKTQYCQRPDHDISEIVCGAPLPCPYHTVIIDTQSVVPTVTIPATAAPQINLKMVGLLKQIARDIDPKSVRRARSGTTRTEGEGEK